MAINLGSSSIGIMQETSHANGFAGTAVSAGTLTYTNGIYRYATIATQAAGLFYFGATEQHIVTGLHVTIVSGDITVNLVNVAADGSIVAGESWKLFTATAVTSLNKSLAELELVLHKRQALQIITTKPGIAYINVALERSYGR